MTKRTKHTPRNRRKSYVRDLGGGLELEAEVSPCVFMYAPYPLQITVTLCRHPGERLGQAYAVDRTKPAANYTDTAVRRLLAGIRTAPCPRCSTPAFDPATVQTNRGGLCEACFLGDLEAEWTAAEETERHEIAVRDRRMKRKGMAVRVTAWVHPQDGGDDYQADWYLDARPTPEQVGNMLRRKGSSRLDDYQITIL